MQKISIWNTHSRTLELTAVFVAYFTSFFVLNSITIALPKITAELNGMQLYSWAISVPALASAIVILTFGKLSDMYGRRLLLLVSTGFMIFGAILCAASQVFVLLIVALAILGMGQGAIQSLCFSVLGDMFPPAERSLWAGLLNISSGITAFIVPTLSGWLVDNLSWRYIFWMHVPLALITGIVVFIGLPALAKREIHKIDVKGTIYLALATSTMILGVSWAGNTYAWASTQTIGLLGVSVVSWVLFLHAETKAPEPMLDLRVLTNRTFIVASASALMSFFGITSIMVYYPLFLQGVQTHSATLSGKAITPFSPVNPPVPMLLITGAWEDILTTEGAQLLMTRLCEEALTSCAGDSPREWMLFDALVHNYEVYSPRVISAAQDWAFPEASSHPPILSSLRIVLWFSTILGIFLSLTGFTNRLQQPHRSRRSRLSVRKNLSGLNYGCG